MIVTDAVRQFWRATPRSDRKSVLILAKQVPMPLLAVSFAVAAARVVHERSQADTISESRSV